MNTDNYVDGRLVPTNSIVLENTLLYRTHESRELARQDFIKASTVQTKNNSKEESEQRELIKLYKSRFENLSSILYERTNDEEYKRIIM